VTVAEVADVLTEQLLVFFGDWAATAAPASTAQAQAMATAYSEAP